MDLGICGSIYTKFGEDIGLLSFVKFVLAFSWLALFTVEIRIYGKKDVKLDAVSQ